jgi:hypothetical protein
LYEAERELENVQLSLECPKSAPMGPALKLTPIPDVEILSSSEIVFALSGRDPSHTPWDDPCSVVFVEVTATELVKAS